MLRIDRATADRIRCKVDSLAGDPATQADNVTALKGGQGLMRLRVGDWRVIHTADLVVLLAIQGRAARPRLRLRMEPMGYEPQTFAAPDGTPMVILPAADYERLKRLAEDGGDAAFASAALARIAGGDGTMPSPVLALIQEGLSPIAAWRRHRGYSQSELARRAGLSQVWIGRIEAGGGNGTRVTRRKIAAALEAPEWALEDERG